MDRKSRNKNRSSKVFFAECKAFLGEFKSCDGGRDDNSAAPELMRSPSGFHGERRSSLDFCGQFQNSRR